MPVRVRLFSPCRRVSRSLQRAGGTAQRAADRSLGASSHGGLARAQTLCPSRARCSGRRTDDPGERGAIDERSRIRTILSVMESPWRREVSRMRTVFVQPFNGRRGRGTVLLKILRSIHRQRFEPALLLPLEDGGSLPDGGLACRPGEQDGSLSRAFHHADRSGGAFSDVFRRVDAATLPRSRRLRGLSLGGAAPWRQNPGQEL